MSRTNDLQRPCISVTNNAFATPGLIGQNPARPPIPLGQIPGPILPRKPPQHHTMPLSAAPLSAHRSAKHIRAYVGRRGLCLMGVKSFTQRQYHGRIPRPATGRQHPITFFLPRHPHPAHFAGSNFFALDVERDIARIAHRGYGGVPTLLKNSELRARPLVDQDMHHRANTHSLPAPNLQDQFLLSRPRKRMDHEERQRFAASTFAHTWQLQKHQFLRRFHLQPSRPLRHTRPLEPQPTQAPWIHRITTRFQRLTARHQRHHQRPCA